MPVATATPAPHEANLFDVQAKYAEVVSEAQALHLLDRETGERVLPGGL